MEQRETRLYSDITLEVDKVIARSHLVTFVDDKDPSDEPHTVVDASDFEPVQTKMHNHHCSPTQSPTGSIAPRTSTESHPVDIKDPISQSFNPKVSNYGCTQVNSQQSCALRELCTELPDENGSVFCSDHQITAATFLLTLSTDNRSILEMKYLYKGNRISRGCRLYKTYRPYTVRPDAHDTAHLQREDRLGH